MNPQSLARFSQAAAQQRATLFGIEVTFRGATITIPKPSVDPTFALEGGGFREEATYRLRLPALIAPPPVAKERITENVTGATYVVVTCVSAAAGAPNAHEHIVEARRA